MSAPEFVDPLMSSWCFCFDQIEAAVGEMEMEVEKDGDLTSVARDTHSSGSTLTIHHPATLPASDTEQRRKRQ